MKRYSILVWILVCALSLPALAAKKAMIERAGELYQGKKYTQAIQFYVKALKQKDTRDNPHALVYYNIACCYSLLHQSKPALTNLKKSIEKGYTNARWIKRDSDFQFVRSADSVRFAELVSMADVLFKDERLAKSPVAVVAYDADRGTFDKSILAWDDPRGPKMTELRTSYKLDSVVAPGKSEFKKMLLLLEWVSTRWQQDGNRSSKSRDGLGILKEVSEGGRFACIQYAIVLANCLTSLGYPARVVGLQAEGTAYEMGRGHSVAEVWSDEYQKWILLDGQWNACWTYRGVPQNAAECRTLYLTGKEDSLEFAGRTPNVDYAQLKGQWVEYFYHVLMSHANEYYPAADSLRHKGDWYVLDNQGTVPELYNQKIPQDCRPIDDEAFLYPKLNQVRINLHPTNRQEATDSLRVTLENSSLFFDHYVASINGREWEKCAQEFIWLLAPGDNHLEVRAVNVRGVEGRAAALTLRNNLH